MRRFAIPIALAAIIVVAGQGVAQQPAPSASTYLGFDRNEYPGDENLPPLRQTFSYAGFWLNHPPGEKANTWAGKRQTLQSAGFGFFILFNGRLDAELKTVSNAARLGKSDAQAAIASARREGFPAGAIIFLDQEEGGRMLPEQKAYIYAWVDGVAAAGFRAGIYCSGIAAKEERGVSIVTAEDIRQSAGRKEDRILDRERCLPAVAGMRLPQAAAQSRRERYRLRRRMAICSIAEAA